MDDLQSQMNAILSDPAAMEKIMAMAQSLGQPPQEAPPVQESFSMPDIDIGMIQKLAGFAGQSNIDQHQKNLLQALSPYLSGERVSKLEKAMRAAKMARMATSVLGQGALFGGGR